MLDKPYFILLLIAGALSLSLAFFAWRRRTSPGATPLVFLMVAAAVSQIGYAFELASSEESTKVLWAKVEYLGIVTVPTAWVAFTLEYTRRGHWLTRRNLALLATVPVVTLLLAWTNEAHSLIWKDVRLESTGSFSVAEFVHGGWFWAFGAYSYLLLVLGGNLSGRCPPSFNSPLLENRRLLCWSPLWCHGPPTGHLVLD